MNLSDVYTTYLPWIEAELRAILACPHPDVSRHYGMMGYHMGWLDADLQPAQAPAGKMIRPLLCLLACAAAGGDSWQAVPAAAGLELLHNFSLVHDDIEDKGATRRQRPTVWVLFGKPQACNAGDGMFSLAHLAFHRLAARGVPAPVILDVLRVFDEMCVALTEGQFLDMAFENRQQVTLDEYLAMIRGKTGALLAAAPQIGALIAGAPPAAVDAYRRYGAALGLAFQLQDDVLGIWGDEAVTGKSAAGDILSKKKTLPVLYALAHPAVAAELTARYAGPAFTLGDVPHILALLDAAGARAYAETRVQDAIAEARQAMQAAALVAEPSAHAALGELLGTLFGLATPYPVFGRPLVAKSSSTASTNTSPLTTC